MPLPRRPSRLLSRLLLLVVASTTFLLLTLLSSRHGRHVGSLDLGTSMWLALSLFHGPAEPEAPAEADLGPPILGPECEALFAGNPEEVRFTKEMLYKESRRGITDHDYIAASKNCSKFIQRRGYPTEPFSKEEQAFPIAYILTVHKHSEQVERLLRAIYAPQNVYCLHVDKKSPASFQMAMAALAQCFHNVFLVSRPVDVVYAGYSRLQADINCMQDLLKVKMPWKYVINLCGQDFPLRTNLEVVRSLKDLEGQNDIAGVIPTDSNIINRYNYKFHVKEVNGIRVIKRTNNPHDPPPHNITIHFGNAYNFFTRAFVNYTLHDPVAQTLLHWMEDVYSPDEFYWTTLQYLPGTPGGATVPSWGSIARVIKWEMFAPKMYPHCQGFYQRGICVFGVGDLYWLYMQSSIFANKFDLARDHVVVGCLELLLKDKVLRQRLGPNDHAEVPGEPFSILGQDGTSSLSSQRLPNR